jgi:hypothetical protein
VLPEATLSLRRDFGLGSYPDAVNFMLPARCKRDALKCLSWVIIVTSPKQSHPPGQRRIGTDPVLYRPHDFSEPVRVNVVIGPECDMPGI